MIEITDIFKVKSGEKKIFVFVVTCLLSLFLIFLHWFQFILAKIRQALKNLINSVINSFLSFSAGYYSAPFTIQRISIVLGRCLFLRSVHTFSLFLKSNWSSDSGQNETGNGANKRVVLRRVRKRCLNKNSLSR